MSREDVLARTMAMVAFAYSAIYGGHYNCQGCKRRLQSGETILTGRTQSGGHLVVGTCCGGLLEQVSGHGVVTDESDAPPEYLRDIAPEGSA